MKTLILLLAASSALTAGQTRTWTQGEAADFEKGILKNLSLRSDGRLTLAPVSRELFDSSSSYLWSLAQDSKGNLYAGGGTSAKLYRITPDGKGKVLADLDALEIHAIAVDSRDRVYAATSPDGKVYRIAANGKPEVFYDPKAKYIWALAFDAAGNLFVATGDQGELHRVTPDGKGTVFFKSDETHIRSLAIDAKGNLILGTEPGGLVLRVSAAGEGFVLYQMPKREVTAVAQAPDGAIYAAAVGSRQPTPSSPSAQAPTFPVPVPNQVAVTVGGGAGANRQPAVPPPSTAPSGVTGGSEVYRIDPDGAPRRVWGHAQDVVYAIAFDATGRAILGAGNKGNVYRIESPTLYTSLLVAAGHPGHGVPGGPRRPSLRRHGKYRQGIRDRSRAGTRRLHRERRLRFRHVFALGPSHLRDQPERRARRPRHPQRQSRPAAEKLERVGRSPCRRQGRPRGFPGGALRAVESHADRRLSGARLGGRGLSAQEPRTARR